MTATRRSLPAMTVWSVVSWIATAAYGFVVTRLLIEGAGEEAYGLWATIVAIRGFILFLDGGLAFCVKRDAALAPERGGSNRIRATWRIYAGIAVATLVVFAVAASLPGRLLGFTGSDAGVARTVTLLLGAETAVALIASPLASILRGSQRFDLLAVSLSAQALLGAGAIAYVIPRYGIIGAAAAALGTRAVVSALTLGWMRAKRLLPGRGVVPAGTIRSVVKFAAPLWLVFIGTQFGVGSDVPIVGGFYDATTAGYYAIGAAIPMFAASLLAAVMGASFPRMVTAGEVNRRRTAGALLFMVSFLAAIGYGFLALHGGSLLRVWVNRAPELSVRVLALSCLAWTINAPAHVLSLFSIARGRHAVLAPVVLAESLANLGLSLLLAWLWSPLGPAIATVAMSSVSNLIVVPAVLRRRLDLSRRAIAQPSLLGAGIGLAGAGAVWAVTTWIDGGALVDVLLGAVFTGLAAGAGLDLTVRGKSKIVRMVRMTMRRGWSTARRQRAEVRRTRVLLAEMRRASPIVISVSKPPLVTVRIATCDRGRIVADRAIASALAQTHRNVEIVVVGDCCDEATAAAVRSVRDPRVRFINLPERGRYPENPLHRWMVAGTVPMNRALEVARGEWIAPLDDDDEFTPDHVEVLLDACRERGLELAYGVAEMERRDGTWTRCGSWPLREGHLVPSAVLWSARVGLRHDVEAWRLHEPGDWNLWRRMRSAGVIMGFVDHVVTRHYAEQREVRAAAPFWSGERG